MFAGLLLPHRMGSDQVDAMTADGTRTIDRPVQIRAQGVKAFQHLPLAFAVNQGQFDPRVQFSAEGAGFRVFLTRQGAMFLLRGGPSKPPDVVQMKLADQNEESRIVGIEKLPGTSNYFVGRDRNSWRKNVPNFQKVKYTDVYPGIDMIFHGDGPELEYDLDVGPKARPSNIKLVISGSNSNLRARVDDLGRLVISTDLGNIYLPTPTTYQQDRSGNRRYVECGWVILGGGPALHGAVEVGFTVGPYDHSRPLVIDPVLSFSTYWGGSSQNTGYALATDSDGNVYLTGYTFSTDFPVVAPLQSTGGSVVYAFVTKFNSAGTVLYSTYLGGGGFNGTGTFGNGIAADAAGNAYITGQTNSSEFPTTPGAFQTSCTIVPNLGECLTGFVTKISANGSQMLYSSYLGGSNVDAANAIAVDNTGAAYITGESSSPDFPTTPGAFSPSPVVGGGRNEAFVVKLSPDGSTLTYGTYLGPSGGDAIALNAAGEAYVAGAGGPGFPVTPGAFQTTAGSAGNLDDAIVARISADGSALLYATFIGGSGTDYAGGIGLDSVGNAFLAGQTDSPNFPVVNAYQDKLNGQFNAYIAKLNPSGTALLYSTYFGGSSDDAADAIAVDSSGNAYITGFTESADFPIINGLQGNYGGVNMDAFLTALNAAGTPTFSTFLGGNDADYGTQGNAVAIDPMGHIYVTGQTNSSDFPILNPQQAFLSTGTTCSPTLGVFTFCDDVFLTEFSLTNSAPVPDFAIYASPTSVSVRAGATANYYVKINPIDGFNQEVTLSCSGLPTGASCSEQTVQPNGFNTAETGIEIVTTLGNGQNQPFDLHSLRDIPSLPVGACLLLSIFALCIVRMHWALPTPVVGLGRYLAIFAVACLMLGCGGSSGGTGIAPTPSPSPIVGTPPGTYTVVLTGNSSGLTHTLNISLTVQ